MQKQIFFGGTFDPIHNGHINLALYISNLFQQKVKLLPLSGQPNYKNAPQATLNQRLNMLEIIANKYSHNIEIDYNEANLSTYSPTVCTLRRLRKIYGDDTHFYFIIGGDSLVNLDSWDEWEQLFELTNFIVALRPDYPLDRMSEQLAMQVQPRLCHDIENNSSSGAVILTHFEPINISSTEIRNKFLHQQSVNNIIDTDILDFITTNHLYSKL